MYLRVFVKKRLLCRLISAIFLLLSLVPCHMSLIELTLTLYAQVQEQGPGRSKLDTTTLR